MINPFFKNHGPIKISRIANLLNINIQSLRFDCEIYDVKDLSSSTKMFRLLQGDVGSWKTIVSLISAFNVINSGFQVAIMAPTEILARQHFNFAKKLYPKEIKAELISGKSEFKNKKDILTSL